ncbi:MAG: signal peptide peptidase SppA [Enterobacteriaceae bacterium]|nr:signal peptide peptidase SppA [Enterobacteriaceae bacterium]
MQNNNHWEKNIIKEFIFLSIKEHRTSRRWNIFFKLTFLVLFLSVFLIILLSQKNIEKTNSKNSNHIALIEINGIISAKEKASSKNIITLLTEAFTNKNAKAIILKINSPGGTPVQSNTIHNYIKKLRISYPNKQIFSVIEDVGTSGAYLISTATEKIYCDPSSIVGSIGVILNSFGFVNTIEKLGIERRIYKSGKYKAIMDPFSKKTEEEDKIIQDSLDDIHDHFINIVKKTRGSNIKNYNFEIFSGRFWTGKEALKLGIVDGFHDIQSLSSEIMETSIIVDYKIDSDILELIKKQLF